MAIVEYKNCGTADEAKERLQNVKRELTSAISRSHGVRVSDLVMVGPGSIPITTSGKIRRSSCIELYRRNEFARLDGAVQSSACTVLRRVSGAGWFSSTKAASSVLKG